MVLLALGFFILTAAPDVLWGDSAKLQWMAWARWLRFDETGHPLWVLVVHPLSRLPWLHPAFAVNLSSAVFSALALWPAHRIMVRLGATRPSASIGCLGLAVSHTFWLHAVIAEVYALNSLVMMLLLDAVTAAIDPSGGGRRGPAWLFLLGAASAVGAANHLLVALWIPGLAWLVYRSWRAGRLAGRAAVAAGLGVTAVGGPMLAARAAFDIGSPFAVIIGSLAGGLLHPADTARAAISCAGYSLYQFPLPILLAAACAGIARIDRDHRTALGIIHGLTFVFAVLHPVKDRFAFLLPSYLIVALAAAPGLDRLTARFRRRGRGGLAVPALFALCVAVPPLVYHAAPSAGALAALARGSGARTLPGRDPSRYFLDPDKRREGGARAFVEAAIDALPPGAVLIADATLGEPLNYVQIVEGRRPDLLVLYIPPERQVDAALAWSRRDRPVFLGATDGYYDVEGLLQHFSLEAAGPVYRLSRLARARAAPHGRVESG